MGSTGVGGSLSAASDVNLNSPATGESLRRTGAYWANAPVTKSDVGLSNIDNTSDADKPVSTAQAAAIASAGGGGVTTLANVAAGSMLVAPLNGSVNTSASTARPSARTDIFFRWRSTVAPTNMITGDEWYQSP